MAIVVIENTLSWPDEFVRHKALDCVGRLSARGASGAGAESLHINRVTGERSCYVRETHQAGGEGKKRDPVIGIEEIMKILPASVSIPAR